MSFITIHSTAGVEEFKDLTRPQLRGQVELVAHDGEVFAGLPVVKYDASSGRHLALDDCFDDVIARAISHVADVTGIDEMELENEYRDHLQREIAGRLWPAITGVMNRRCLALALWYGIMSRPEGGEYILEIPGMGEQRFLDYNDALQAASVALTRMDDGNETKH